jgi:MFS family permease
MSRPAQQNAPVRRAPWNDRQRLVSPILLILAVTDSAGYSIIGPVLPTLRTSTGASVTELSLLAACFPLAMLGGLIVAGRLAHVDRTRTALILGLGLLAAATLVFAFATDLDVLFAARAFMGVGSGCLWIGLTLRTLEYWPGEEYVRMSRVYAGYSVGALVGPLLASLGGVRAPFVAYTVVLVGCLPLVLLLPVPQGRPVLRRDRAVMGTSSFWFAALAILFAMMSFGTLDGVLPLHFATHLSQSQIGLAYTLTAVLVAVSSAAAGRTRPGVALTLGGLGIVGGVSIAGASGSVLVWAVALALVGLGAGAAETGATGVLLDAVPSERIVSAMVVWSQVGMLGYLLAPTLGGQVVTRLSFTWLGLVPLAAGCAVVVAALLARSARRAAPHPISTPTPTPPVDGVDPIWWTS